MGRRLREKEAAGGGAQVVLYQKGEGLRAYQAITAGVLVALSLMPGACCVGFLVIMISLSASSIRLASVACGICSSSAAECLGKR